MDLRPLTRYCVRQGNIRFARTTVLSKRTIFEAAVYIAIGFVVFWTQRSCTDQNIHSWGRKSFTEGMKYQKRLEEIQSLCG